MHQPLSLKRLLKLRSWLAIKTTQKSVQYLKGIGPRRFLLLQKMGVETVADLAYLFPRRYEDRGNLIPIAAIQPGKFMTIQGVIEKARLRPIKHLRIFEIKIKDQAGHSIDAVWFNQIYLKSQLLEGKTVLISGKVDFYQKRLQFSAPEYEIVDSDEDVHIHTGRITPIYPLTDGLFQRSLRRVMSELVAQNFYDEIHEHLPSPLIDQYKFLPLTESLREVHFPSSFEKLASAKERLIFDELFLLELKLLKRARDIKLKQSAISFRVPPNSATQFSLAMPFPLTQDQKTAIANLAVDLEKPHPMHRLLQGEVGSGKTVVAAYALKLAATNNLQAAFLVPTEILAEQHFVTLRKFLEPQDVKVELLTASTIEPVRSAVFRGISTGDTDVIVGTHALLQESVDFHQLGLVIIDEQHKFGVEQRAKLLNREPKPHLLVMSATPIPRTLGLTLFGDLDISTLKELPAGRKQISTQIMTTDNQSAISQLIRTTIERGEQAYILYPLIEESDRLEAQAATTEFTRLSQSTFKDIPMALIHGRVSKFDRDRAMESFRSGQIKILIATTVIEVGLDNPNATLMIIYNADRFGLSQLHQIRGRIGRGNKNSTCILIANPKTEDARKRLAIMVKSNDGFDIAEEDLRLRGPGEFFGLKQSGIANFKIADMVRDEKVLHEARKDALSILEKDPDLTNSKHTTLQRYVQ